MQLPGKELDNEVIAGSETLVVAIVEDRITPETKVGEVTQVWKVADQSPLELVKLIGHPDRE